ncbi:hypothetical protein B0H13DRAFT_2348924 [Mycena leptocephala]|nr:hypothetical protein B0H13DRAFT_2348924 [Mycena leptocephala]
MLGPGTSPRQAPDPMRLIHIALQSTLCRLYPCCRHAHQHSPGTSPQFCNNIVSSSSTAASAVAALLALDLTGLDVPVGLSCSPNAVVGNNCGSTTVVCDTPDNERGALVAINCIPITL